MLRTVSGSDFSSGFRLIRNDIFLTFWTAPRNCREILFRGTNLDRRNKISKTSALTLMGIQQLNLS